MNTLRNTLIFGLVAMVTCLPQGLKKEEGNEVKQENKFAALETTVQQLVSRVTQLEAENNRLKAEITELSTKTAADTAFLASITAEEFAPGDPIVFDNAVLNPQGHYDVTTGVYTVPADGIYQFTFHYISFEGGPATNLVVDGVNVAYTIGSTANCMVFTLNLAVGQRVWLSPVNLPEVVGSNGGSPATWFSGHMI